jgi:hypothetical protein
MPRRDVTEAVKQQILDMRRSTAYTDGEIGAKLGLSRGTVVRYGKGARGDDPRRFLSAGHPGRGHPGRGHPAPPLPPARGSTGEPPMPRSLANAPGLPPSLTAARTPLQIDTPGWWLVMGDQHVPFHDERAIEAAVAEAKAVGVVGVLVNGDAMDMIRVSPFHREPMDGGVKSEVEAGRQFFRWLRWHFPTQRAVYRQGNHEMRWEKYVIGGAKELFGLDELTLPSLLKLVNLGKLPTLHGHELSKGMGVNPARYAFLKTTNSVLVSHWHQTSNHTQRTLLGKQIATYSIGCLCDLSPTYAPYGQANHGFGLVKVEPNGDYMVRNHRIRDGRVE